MTKKEKILKYIFLDIDGTLFSPKINGVPESALKALELAKKKGNKIYLCTGRALPECKLYLDYDVDGFIFSAGAIVYSNKKRIFEQNFEEEFIDKLINLCEEVKVGFIIGGSAGAYANDRGYKEVSNYFTSGCCDPNETREILMDNGVFKIKDWHYLDTINKICIYANDLDTVNKLVAMLGDNYIFALSHSGDNRFFGDIIRKDVNKFFGITKVLEHESALLEDTICIGDSNNDIDMLQGCHIGIAMGNAYENVKECADYVTSDILEDGVYNAFKKFDLI